MSSKLLNDRQVAEKLSCSRSHVWQLLKENNQFPRPLKLSNRVTRWHSNAIDVYINSLFSRSKNSLLEFDSSAIDCNQN